MRKMGLNELAILFFALFTWITLLIAPDLFQTVQLQYESGAYSRYLELLGGQTVVANVSLAIMILYAGLPFIRNYNVRIIINTIGLAFYNVIAISYILSYPNLSLSVFVILDVVLWIALFKFIDESEERKKESKIKRIESHIEGGDNE